MPQKGLTEQSALLSSFHVKEGDTVKPGQLLFSLETGKAVFDVESEVSGTVLKVLGEEGDEVAVKAVVMVIGEPGERVEQFLSPTSATLMESENSMQTSMPVHAVVEPSPSRKIRISPRARRLVEKRGIPLEDLNGSGPGGRILVEDVEAHQKRNEMSTAPVIANNGEEIDISPMRAMIAQRLSKSWFTAPHVFLRTAVVMDMLLDIRSKLGRETGEKISLNAMIMKFAAEALKRHPRINASWQENSIRLFPTIDIALAVALPDGLITPVVRDCGNKGMQEIDRELTVLIEKARKGGLSPSEYANSTFTISNLGGFGIEEFTAIINPPGSAILALGAAKKEPVVLEDDTIGIQTIMRMTLSCDHRSIDGAAGAAFLQDLHRSMQEPLRALL